MNKAQWPDRDRVEQYVANHPGAVTDLLAQHLEQTDLDILFRELFPPATDQQERLALDQARRILTRADYPLESEIVRAIDTEAAALASAEALPSAG